MYRFVALLIVAAIVPLSGCGAKKKLCKDKTPASFATFLDDDWRGYCESYRTHVEAPGNVSLVELTEFFGHHPERVRELKKSLDRFEKYDTCFESPKEELELRNLQTCLQDNDQADIEITNAWSSQADPWIQEMQLRVGEVAQRVSDAEREAARQLKKVGESFDFQSRVEGTDWESLQLELKSLDKALEGIQDIDSEFKTVLERAQGHDALVRLMEVTYAPQVNAIAADVASLRGRHGDLMKTIRFLEFATNAAGVPCPKTLKGSSKEFNIARKIVSGKNNEVGGSGPRILMRIAPDTQGDTTFERFEGYVCGIRSSQNQFEGVAQLCGQYRWVVERQKPVNEKKWGDWTLKSFEESGPDGGVDCGLKKK